MVATAAGDHGEQGRPRLALSQVRRPRCGSCSGGAGADADAPTLETQLRLLTDHGIREDPISPTWPAAAHRVARAGST